jgi:hypothetical protein
MHSVGGGGEIRYKDYDCHLPWAINDYQQEIWTSGSYGSRQFTAKNASVSATVVQAARVEQMHPVPGQWACRWLQPRNGTLPLSAADESRSNKCIHRKCTQAPGERPIATDDGMHHDDHGLNKERFCLRILTWSLICSCIY